MADPADALTVTALLASEPDAPVIVYDSNAALKIAIVDRRSLGLLDEEWEASGVYLLLDPVTFDGAYGVYVGMAPSGLRNRVRQHASASRGKDHWARAILIRRDTTHGWHSAQVGWLEGRLCDQIDGASLATLSNQVRPDDEALPLHDRA